MVFCDWLNSTASVASPLANKPLLIRIHRHEIYHPELIEAVNWNAVNAVVAVSHGYERVIRSVIKRIAVHTIYNGVDLDRFRFEPCVSGLVCNYAFHSGMKRSYDLMLALRDFELCIGGADGEEGHDMPVMKSAIDRFGLRHKLYGYVDLPAWLHDKEYFVTHSMDEGCPVALLETMASGLICLSHENRVAKEILPDQYCYRYDDELISKLRFFKGLPDQERFEHKLKMRKIVESQFDVKEQANAFRKLFLSCLS